MPLTILINIFIFETRVFEQIDVGCMYNIRQKQLINNKKKTKTTGFQNILKRFMTMQQMFNKLTFNSKRLFIVDGLGACLTAFLLAAILTPLNEYFGMPRTVLIILSIIAFFFAFYSICCFFLINKKWQPFLKIIAIANILYCCLTTLFVIKYFTILTILGVSYFLFEIAIICGLVFFEIRALAVNSRKTGNDYSLLKKLQK